MTLCGSDKMDDLSVASDSSGSIRDDLSLSSWDHSVDRSSDSDSQQSAIVGSRRRRQRLRPLTEFGDPAVGAAILTHMRMTRALRQRTKKRVDSKRYVVDDGADRIGGQTTSLAPGQAKPRLLQRVRAICLLAPNDIFFDVGSGEGFAAMALGAATGCHAYGIEIVPWRHQDSVDIAKKFCQSMSRSNEFAELCGYERPVAAGHALSDVDAVDTSVALPQQSLLPSSCLSQANSGTANTCPTPLGAKTAAWSQRVAAVARLQSNVSSLDHGSVGPASTCSSIHISADPLATGGLSSPSPPHSQSGSPRQGVARSAGAYGRSGPVLLSECAHTDACATVPKPRTTSLLRTVSGSSGDLGSRAHGVASGSKGRKGGGACVSGGGGLGSPATFASLVVPPSRLAPDTSVRCLLCAAQAFGRGEEWGPHPAHCRLAAGRSIRTRASTDSLGPKSSAPSSAQRGRVDARLRRSVGDALAPPPRRSAPHAGLPPDLVGPLRCPHPEFEFAVLVARVLAAASTSASQGANSLALDIPASSDGVCGAAAATALRRGVAPSGVGHVSLPPAASAPASVSSRPAVPSEADATDPLTEALVDAGSQGLAVFAKPLWPAAASAAAASRAGVSQCAAPSRAFQGSPTFRAGSGLASSPTGHADSPRRTTVGAAVTENTGAATSSSHCSNDEAATHSYAIVFSGWGGRVRERPAETGRVAALGPRIAPTLRAAGSPPLSPSLRRLPIASTPEIVPAEADGESHARTNSGGHGREEVERRAVVAVSSESVAVELPTTDTLSAPALSTPTAGTLPAMLGASLLPLHQRLHLVRGDALQLLARSGPALEALRRSRVVFCNNFDAKWTGKVSVFSRSSARVHDGDSYLVPFLSHAEDGFQQSIFRLLSRHMARGAILVSCSRFTRGVRRWGVRLGSLSLLLCAFRAGALPSLRCCFQLCFVTVTV